MQIVKLPIKPQRDITVNDKVEVRLTGKVSSVGKSELCSPDDKDMDTIFLSLSDVSVSEVVKTMAADKVTEGARKAWKDYQSAKSMGKSKLKQ